MAIETHLPKTELQQLQSRIKTRLAELKDRRLLIIGDVGLDEYVIGDVKRISPEAPVPVVEVYSQDERLGLAANVAQNVVSLGGKAELIAVVGADSAGERVRDQLVKAGVGAGNLLSVDDRPTTRKLRVMAEHHHVVRVDFEQRKFLSAADEARLLKRFDDLLPTMDAVILEDYAKGLLTERVCSEIIRRTHAAGKRVVVDPHPLTPASFYYGVDLMTPNRDEAVALSGVVLDDLRERPDQMLEVGHALMAKVAAKQLVITRGKDGMSLYSDGKVLRLPTFARQVFDVTGAGDTVIAALTLAWVSGFDLIEACVLANCAAGVVVGKVGCVPCSQQELLDAVSSFS